MLAKLAFILLGTFLFIQYGAGQVTPYSASTAASLAGTPIYDTYQRCRGSNSNLCECFWLYWRYCWPRFRHPLCWCVTFCPWPWGSQIDYAAAAQGLPDNGQFAE